MIDLKCRIWIKPEKRMIVSDWEYTCMQINHIPKELKSGDSDGIGFLADYDGAIAEVMLYSSKKDMYGDKVCDGDIIYITPHCKPYTVKFDGCDFILISRNDKVFGSLADIEEDQIVIMGNVYEGMKN